jgi:ABC-type multidrug transport system ATPase subunit
MQSSTAQYIDSRVGDPGETPTDNMTPMAHNNMAGGNRTAVSPTSPNGNDLASPNFAPRGQVEVAPDVEEAPLVKHHGGVAESPMRGGSKPVTLTFQDLKYSVRVKNPNKQSPSDPKFVQREILKGMTGVCRPRELTAIMGASGAGKTTLLNILSCRVDPKGKNPLSGSILANGQSYDIGKFSKFAGYVMQNDILLETMTPREIFTFTASLRLNANPEERTKKVNKLIQDLKLERAADTQVGGTFSKGISGGERKRTSIGVELITDPNLIFLDEPTSGLDSFTAFILISLLKSMAVHGGKTIIFTIHQPSSDIFFMFDNLMILAKGKFIYQGPTRFAVPHFNKIGYQCPEYSNPADYFIEVAHSDQDEDKKFDVMYQAYDENIAPQIEHEVKTVQQKELALAEKVNSFMTSLLLISKRSFLNFVRNPILLKGRIGQSGKTINEECPFNLDSVYYLIDLYFVFQNQ